MNFLTKEPFSYGISFEKFSLLILPHNNPFLKEKALLNRNLKISFKKTKEIGPLHHEIESLFREFWALQFNFFHYFEQQILGFLEETCWNLKPFYQEIDQKNEGFVNYEK